jgi:hypothetical protein
MAASVTRIQSALNSFVHAILICYDRSKYFDFYHIFEGFAIHLLLCNFSRQCGNDMDNYLDFTVSIFYIACDVDYASCQEQTRTPALEVVDTKRIDQKPSVPGGCMATEFPAIVAASPQSVSFTDILDRCHHRLPAERSEIQCLFLHDSVPGPKLDAVRVGKVDIVKLNFYLTTLPGFKVYTAE